MPKKIKVKAKKQKNLETAIRHYQSGSLKQAEMICRQILKKNPNNSDTLHLLGLILIQAGKYELAINHISKAIHVTPNMYSYYFDLGNAFACTGQIDEAINNFKKTIELKPDYFGAYNSLGNALKEKGIFDEAINYYRKALTIKPDYAEAYHNLGAALKEKGKLDEAINNYRKALKLKLDNPLAYYNLGTALAEKGKLDEAIEEFRKALKLKPDFAEAHYNLGVALKEKGMFDEVIEELRKALTIKPDYADAYNNLGTAFKEKGMLDKAINNYRKALTLSHDNPLVYYNLGSAFSDKGLIGEALNHYRMALSLKPDYSDAHWNMSLLLLKRSNFEQGWRKFEWRLLEKDYIPLYSPQPHWNGLPLKDRTLLIQAEQGVGDEIMFASCLPDVISQGGHCVLECDMRLMPLFSRSFPEVKLIPRINADYPDQNHLPQADVKIAIGSLPLHFRPDLSSFPQQKSYLVPDKQEVERWSIRFKELGEGLKVGISWRGGKEARVRHMRSTALQRWTDLFSIAGIHFINLQYGDSVRELQEIKEETGVTIHDWEDADPLKNLDDFAAQIAALDLVISVDNSTVHMAGALGVPVWTLLPFACDWRWMQEVDDTPWYKSVKLYRQSTLGDWESVLGRVEYDLREYVTTGVMPGIEHGSSYENTCEGIGIGKDKEKVKQEIQERPSNKTGAEKELVNSSSFSLPSPVLVPVYSYKCAVITPVGPGHEGLYEECLASINKSYDKDKGRFSEIILVRVDDTDGRLGRSRARNKGIKQAAEQGAEWLFFLDADDLMAPSAFEYASNYLDKYDAVWGSIWSIEEGQQARERDGQLSFLWSIEDVLSFDPFVSLQMGHFVKTSVALSALFNESLDTGEDFDYYLRVWEKHKCIKIPLPFFYNRRGLHSEGPRSATGGQWRQEVEGIISKYRGKLNP